MEKLLAFHVTDSNLTKLKNVADTMKIQLETIAPADYFQTLENLVNGQPDPLAAPFTGKAPAESLLLFCGFTDKRMDRVLAALRTNNILVSYKAALTPTNKRWNFMQLLLEMRMESVPPKL